VNRHIIYIINPVSGTRTKKDLQGLIEKKTAEAGIPFQIFPSVESGDYSFLYSTIKTQKTTEIVVAAGDGTVSQVVHALKDRSLNFGIIPCGSGNGLALAAGIPKHPGKALAIIFNGKASPIDGFYLNGKFACMLCGLGFDAKVAQDFANQPERGLTTYIKQTLKNFFSAGTYPFVIETENTKIETDAYFISVANSNQFGNNFTIAPKASLNDGLLDIVIAANRNKLDLIMQTFRQIRGMNKLQQVSMIKKQTGLIYFQARELHISNPSLAPLHMDGDPAETKKKFDIRVEEKSFRLLQP
jgi:diacylglycerol kinase (ATP)